MEVYLKIGKVLYRYSVKMHNINATFLIVTHLLNTGRAGQIYFMMEVAM